MLLSHTLLGAILGILLMKTAVAQQGVYYKDAVQLAARLSSEDKVAELSEHLIYTIEDALLSVAQSSYQEAKAVVQEYNIHTATLSSTQQLHLIVDNQAPWLHDLEAQNPISTYLYQQAIQLKVVEKEKEYTLIALQSEQALNMKFLANELSILEHIWLVEIPSEQKGGKDIQLSTTEEGYHLVYSCPVQPQSQQIHYWEFLVSTTGMVTFLGEYGAALTSQLNNNGERL